MPPLPSPGNVIRISFYISDESDIPAGSRIYAAYSGSPITQTNINALATNVAAEWNTNLASLTATTDTLDSIECQDLSSSVGVVGVASPSDAGTRSGTAMPASVAANIGHVIDRHYRGGKPKTFLRCGVIADLHSSETNQWSSTFLTALKTGWQAFIAGVISTANCNIGNVVNVSYYQGFTSVLNPVTGRTRDVPKLRTGSPQVDTITDAIIRPKLGSQRRRLN